MGRIKGREKATGRRLVDALKEMLPDLGIDISTMTFSLIGFGNVGSWTGRLLNDLGAKMVAVADHTGAIHNDGGIDPVLLAEHVIEADGVSDSTEGANAPSTPAGDAILTQRGVEILPTILCNAGSYGARMVVATTCAISP